MALLKKLMDRGDGQSQVSLAGNLERLFKHAQDEGQTLQALIASAETRAAEMPQVNASLEEARRRASALLQQLESLAARVDGFELVRERVETLETRLASLEGGVKKAEDRVEQTLARDAHVEQHREAVQELVALGQGTLGRIEDIKRERTALAHLEEQLPGLRHEIQPLVDQQAALKTDLDALRGTVAVLTQDAETGREASLKARAHATKATEVVADLQRKLEPLSQIRALGQDTEAQLRSLNALAEHVSAKVKALENQQSVVEHALVESRRVHEMVWEMDVQIAKLAEGAKRATRVEETLARIDQVHLETTGQLAEAVRAREIFVGQVARQDHDAHGLLETLQRHVDQLAVSSRELETIHEQVHVAQAAIIAAEARVEGLTAKDQELSELAGRIEQLGSGLQQLTGQADGLQRRQGELGTLEGRLNALEATAKRTQRQFDGLAEQRKDLETLKKEIQGVHTTYEQTTALLDKLRADKREVEHFLDKAGGFMGQASQIEAKIDALTSQVAQAEASASRTSGIAEVVGELANKLEVIEPRTEVVGELEERLNALNTLSADVDGRMHDQLERRAELENLRVLCDSVAAQLVDAQQKLASMNSAQAHLEPAIARIAELQTDVDHARSTLNELKRDEDTLEAQQRRFEELAEKSGALAVDVAGRLETVQGLQSELGRAGALKEQLLGELAQIQTQQRDTFEHLGAAEDQVNRIEQLWKTLDQRRSQLEEAERTLGAVESRMGELGRLSDTVDRKIQAIAEREHVVEAVKREVEGIHALGLKSQAELAAVADRRAEIAQAKSELDRLRDSLVGTQERIIAIESRRQLIDDVQRKTDTITHLLGDVQITLDSVSEQKAMVDHVFSELARLEYVTQEARGTMKALQAERDVAQRIVENVRQIHARTASEDRKSA